MFYLSKYPTAFLGKFCFSYWFQIEPGRQRLNFESLCGKLNRPLKIGFDIRQLPVEGMKPLQSKTSCIFPFSFTNSCLFI